MRKTNKVIAIVGPTASGKSNLAVSVAQAIDNEKDRYGLSGCEIISADSRQTYKELNVYSNKITEKEMCGIPHHLINIASVHESFSVAQYQKYARNHINNIHTRNALPIVCGGTGYYIDAALYKTPLPKVPPQPRLRAKLSDRSTEALFELLQKHDPDRAATIDRHNPHRLIRALEIVLISGKPVPKMKDRTLLYETLFIGINTTREQLVEKIERRLIAIIDNGTAIEEVRSLHENEGIPWERFEELGMGYKHIAEYLQGLYSKETLKENIRRSEIAYVKRQLTWFKRNRPITWIDDPQRAIAIARDFLVREAPASPAR
jgi:tRNA dimethylallyltransferase